MSPQKLVELAIAEWIGLTGADAAERLGVSQQAVSRGRKSDDYPAIREQVFDYLTEVKLRTQVEFMVAQDAMDAKIAD